MTNEHREEAFLWKTPVHILTLFTCQINISFSLCSNNLRKGSVLEESPILLQNDFLLFKTDNEQKQKIPAKKSG